MVNVQKLKEMCLSLSDRGIQATRQLEKLNTETEILSLCIRRRLVIPGITPNYSLTFRPTNQYALNRNPDNPIMIDARRFSQNETPRHSTESQPRQSTSTTSSLVAQFSRSQKVDEVQQLVAREIGRKWKPLGRALQFTEGFLEELEDRHPRSLQEKIVDMITALQQQCKLEEELIQRITAALKSVGRNDLVRQIEGL